MSAVQYIRESMFERLPERAGMNSVRIAEVLNYQKRLPALVTLAHIHALMSAASRTERDIQSLFAENKLRRITLVGRGNEVSGLSELLIPTDEYEAMVLNSGLPADAISSFLKVLRKNAKVNSFSLAALGQQHFDLLVQHGFLVMPSMSLGRTVAKTEDSVVSHGTISRSASGSQAAVGGEAAFEVLGGVNGMRRTSSNAFSGYILSVPGIGQFVQLVNASRDHFLNMLRQFSTYHQAPLYLLRERWNGNVDSDENHVSVIKRVRGEFSNVTPAKTKKWKAFHGLTFDWVLEECLGAGLIELFETGSVGLGVRALV